MAELTKDETRNRILRLWAAAAILSTIAIFAGHACTHAVAAGDTWVAMACGRHFVNHGVDTVEPFSFNSHKAGPSDAQLERFPVWTRPIIRKIHPTGWINQNWLTHVIFYRLTTLFAPEGEYNYNALVYWKFAVTLIGTICVYYTGRVLGASAAWAGAGACFAALIGRTFIDIRPAVFSNMLVAVFLLVLVLTAYKNKRYIWLMVPLVVFWCNVHGGYIYAFMILAIFVGVHFITIPAGKAVVNIGFKGVLEVAAAGVCAFLAMILFNPFHVTNLTHTFEISISEHARSWRTVHEWQGAFKWDNNVGNAKSFLVMFIIMWVALGVWAAARCLKPRVETRRRARANANAIQGSFAWPKIDLAYIAIAGFLVYMAVDMRRFIPVAAVAMCPLIAVFFEQSLKMSAARVQFNRTGRLDVPALPAWTGWAVPAGFTVIAVVLGGAWGARYKRTYLDPWGLDDVRDSVFMRMTASNLKPFDACRFIRDNKLSGRIFNDWTEGGAVAFGQDPDPETGHIPLKLFMDGRAQAAYNHDKFRLWQYIKSGGPYASIPRRAGRDLTADDYQRIGEWIDAELRRHDVWLTLMPGHEINKEYMTGLRMQANWRIAYMDNYQFLLVNKDTPQGLQLLEDVLNQRAKFPDEFSKQLTLAKNLLSLRDEDLSLRGLGHAMKAFELDNSQWPMHLLVNEAARSHGHLQGPATAYIAEWLEEFIADKDTYARQGGYTKRLVAATIAASYLAGTGHPEYRKYSGLAGMYNREQKGIADRSRW